LVVPVEPFQSALEEPRPLVALRQVVQRRLISRLQEVQAWVALNRLTLALEEVQQAVPV